MTDAMQCLTWLVNNRVFVELETKPISQPDGSVKLLYAVVVEDDAGEQLGACHEDLKQAIRLAKKHVESSLVDGLIVSDERIEE